MTSDDAYDKSYVFISVELVLLLGYDLCFYISRIG